MDEVLLSERVEYIFQFRVASSPIILPLSGKKTYVDAIVIATSIIKVPLGINWATVMHCAPSLDVH